MDNLKRTINLGSFTSVTAGSAIDIAGKVISGATLIIYGTFVGTLELEVSPDGTNWVQAVDNQDAVISETTEKAVLVASDGLEVRGNCTAYTSGTINAVLIVPDD